MSAVRVVGIHPRGELEHRARLLAALAEAFPTVRFEAREAGAWSDLDALVEFGGESAAAAAAAAGTRALAVVASEGAPTAPRQTTLADSGCLDARLRGQALTDAYLGASAPLEPAAGTEVVALTDGRPVWTRCGRLDVAAVGPCELSTDEPLRTRLRDGRSLALLPLAELLREVTADDRWRPPPARAAFLLDDPNLHWPSYGHVKLPQLAHHATEHGYHLALAMVPLDAWFTHPAAARLLRERPSLSLLAHGNDHLGGELGAIEDEVSALVLAAQAQRRISAFEQRTGIRVSRVMAPPHEECSRAVSRALARVGFDAITMTRPYPWLAPPPRHWLTAPAGAAALAGWRPADLSPGNLPVLLRHPLSAEHCSRAELVLRAYLDQPLILYGHHGDLADGLDVLAERAAEVNRIGGSVRWGSLGDIAAASCECRVEGSLLRLRPYARRIAIEPPAGIAQVVVEPPAGFATDELVSTGAGATVRTGEPFPLDGLRSLRLTLHARNAVAAEAIPAPPRRTWPLARRLAGEARDRFAPTRGIADGLRRTGLSRQRTPS